MQYIFVKVNGYNMPVYQIAKNENFETFTTSKKDQAEGFDRIPNEYPCRNNGVDRFPNYPTQKDGAVAAKMPLPKQNPLPTIE